MKICLISNLYAPYQRGGAEQVVKNTVEGLISSGFEVIIITASPIGGLKNEFLPNRKLKIFRFYPANLFFYGYDYKYPAWIRFFWHILDMFNLYSYFKVRWILRREQPRLAHTHNLKGLGYLIPLAIRHEKIFHVHTLHDVQLITPSSIIIKGEEDKALFNFFPRQWYEKITKFLFDSPDVIISPSNFLLDFYSKRGFFPNSKKVVIPNPVMEIINGAVSANDELTRKNFNFLYVGQVEEHKGILFLIQAFKKLISQKNEGDGAILHIVGSGSKLLKAKQLADGTPQIVFHGRLEHKEIAKFFSRADITVVPSLCYENSPTVIFESFSFAVPVLASSIEGVAELIKDGENGITFEAGIIDSLVEKMRWCVKDPEKVLMMRRAAVESAKGRGLSQYIDKIVKLCYNV